MSRTALLALWTTLVVQAAWIGWAATQTAASHLVYPAIATFVFLLLAPTRGRRAWVLNRVDASRLSVDALWRRQRVART